MFLLLYNFLLPSAHVTQVLVNGLNANFVRKNYLEKVVPDDEYDHDIKSFTARYKAALHASDQGDLIVELPPGVTIQESNVISLQSAK